MPMNNSNDRSASKILTFAVGDALLVGSAACGGGGAAHHVNEPVPAPAAEEATETTEAETMEAEAMEAEATEVEATEEISVNEPAPE